MRLLKTIGMLLLLGGVVYGQRSSTETRIIPQVNSPVKIKAATAIYIGTSSRYTDRGIHYELEYENLSTRDIIAVEFGLVAFDVWNEFLDRTGGITMTPLAAGQTAKGEWVASRYADFSFHTGVAYVNRVRFADGEIWSAETTAIVAEMRKIQKDFDASKLKKKTDEKP